MRRKRHVELPEAVDAVLLGLMGHPGHDADSLHRIVAIGRLAAEHQCVGAAVDGIGYVRHLGARGPRIVNHALQHLCGYDDGLVRTNRLVDQQTLDAGDTFLRHLDAQVAAGHHDAVGRLENFLNVVHPFLILYFCNDADVAVLLVEQTAHRHDILARTDETVSDEVDSGFDGKINVLAVAVGERRQLDALSRHIHAFARAQRAVVLHAALQAAVGLSFHLEANLAVVNENLRAHTHVLHKIAVGHGNPFPRGQCIRVVFQLHIVALAQFDRRFAARGPHFRSLGVHQNGNMTGNSPHIVNDPLHPDGILMCRIETHHIHAGFKKAANQVNVAAVVGNRCYNFRLFIHMK